MLIEFDIPSPVDVKALNIFVRALCAYDVLWLQRHPEAPNLYESGVRYATQPLGIERFKPIPLVLSQGTADCDQLAPWRAAELRVRHNVRAMPEVKQMGRALFHVFVRLPDGRAEDVSAHLGMKVPERLAAAGRKLLGTQHHNRKRTHAPVRSAHPATGSWPWLNP